MAFSVSRKLFDIGATLVIRYLVGGARLNCSLVVPKIATLVAKLVMREPAR